MSRALRLTFLAAVMTTNTVCKKETTVAPVDWDLSGKIVFNTIGGDGKNHGIFIIDMNSPDLTLTLLVAQGIEPAVNSTGSELLFTGWGPGIINIFRISISGGNAVNLTSDPSVADSWSDWSPDGQTIAFNRVFPYPSVKEAIVLMNSDGGSPRLLTDTAVLQSSIMARWSPDGTLIAFEAQSVAAPTEYSLYIASSDGSNQVALDPLGAPPESIPLWAPDSRRLAYQRAYSGAQGGLYVIDAKSKLTQKVTAASTGIAAHGYSWLPDGRLVCRGRTSTDTSDAIFVATISSTIDLRRIASGFRGNGAATTASPDGKHIAICGIAGSDPSFGLYVVGSDGSDFRKLKDIDADPKAFIDDWHYCQWMK